MNSQMVGWFEVPVLDMDRAVKFYNSVFNIVIKVQQFGPTAMGWFPFSEDENAKGASGTLIHNPAHYTPSEQGPLLYFTSRSGDINDELGRIEAAGGEILRTKTQISEDHGYMALFKDSEGNRIALHSLK
jgi:predicted enzyme related to lactoylglutathione lyase